MIDTVFQDKLTSDSGLADRVRSHGEFFTQVWRECANQQPVFGKPVSFWIKKRREHHLKNFIKQSKVLSRDRDRFLSHPELQEQIFIQIQHFLAEAVGISARHLDLLMSAEFKNSTKEFISMARKFDASLAPADLFQACRNVWIMNGLQLLLGLKVRFTPAICAYSLLYPFTDNYLDDRAVPALDKESFNRRFMLRLQGERVQPINNHEKSIFALVEIIEMQFDRALYPQVFDSLVAIQQAQAKSVSLIHPGHSLPPEDILAISLEKGGTSVVADGYLVAGNLTAEQEQFLYGYGAYLQFLDDLQDVAEDAARGQKTIYSSCPESILLDKLVEQTFSFGEQVMSIFPPMRSTSADAYLDIIEMCVRLMLIEALCFASDRFSPRFVKQVEKFSPFRFKIMRKVKKKHEPYYMAMFGKTA